MIPSERQRPSRRSLTLPPGSALALVLLTLILLVVIPLTISAWTDAREQAARARYDNLHLAVDGLARQVEELRGQLLTLRAGGRAGAGPDPLLVRAMNQSTDALTRSVERTAPELADLAWSVQRAWTRWKDRYERSSALNSEFLLQSVQMLRTLTEGIDAFRSAVDRAQAAASDESRRLRRVQGYIQGMLGLLSLLAGVVVYRAQRFIYASVDRLKGEQRKLRAIYESVDVGIALWDARELRLTVNPAGLRILGVTREADLRNDPQFLDEFHPRAADGGPIPPEQMPLPAALAGKEFDDCEVRLRRADGQEVLVLFGGAPVLRDHAGSVELAVNSFRDVTSLREAEQRMRHLAASHARRVRELEALFALSRDLAVEGGPERLSERLTAQVAQLFGAERCAIWLLEEGRKELTPQLPAFGFAEEELRDALLPVNPGHWTSAVLNRDGTALNIRETAGDRELSLLAVRLSAGGKPLGILSVYRRADGPEFADADARLLRTFAAQAAFVIRSAKLYEEANRRAELLSWAMKETHHRIKNNLQAVSAILDMQITDHRQEPVSPETLQDILRQIRTIAVVHDLLGHSLQEAQEGAVSARVVVEELVPVITMGQAEKRLSVSLDVEDVLLSSKTAMALGMVINELVSNSIKHGGRAARTIEVGIGIHLEEGSLRLEVEDNGPGFPPGFDPRANGGIGLDLVRMLVERDLSGTIRFSNARGGKVEAILPLPGIRPEDFRGLTRGRT